MPLASTTWCHMWVMTRSKMPELRCSGPMTKKPMYQMRCPS